MLVRPARIFTAVVGRAGFVTARPVASVLARHASSDAIAPRNAKSDVSTETVAVEDKTTLSAFTGAPAAMMETRVVKIYQQAQSVQNATQNMIPWRLQWDDDQTNRWTNPLMGWTSTNDPLSNTHMTLEFYTAEDAARFCERNGAYFAHSLPPLPGISHALETHPMPRGMRLQR